MLKSLWHRLTAGRDPTGPTAVPAELVEQARRRQTAPLVAWLGEALRVRADAPQLPAVLDVVRAAGWHARDVAKLAIVAASIAGRWTMALERALPYLEEDFDADVCLVAAQAFYELNRPEEAWRRLCVAIEQHPPLGERADFMRLCAAAAYGDNRIAEALLWLQRCRGRAPELGQDGLALMIFFEAGEMQAVREITQALDTATTTDAMTEVARAVVALAQEDYVTGFARFEARLSLDNAPTFLNGALLDRPRWQGEPLAGRTLLVSAEQGLGDTVMMARYLPLLKDKGAGQVIVEAQAEAVPLLAAAFPTLTVIERRLGAVPPAPTFELWLGMMSLPHVFGTTVETIPGRAGYLAAPAESRSYWQRRVAALAPQDLPRIGLCWSGRRTHRADRRRSLAAEALLPRIAALPAVFFAVQKEVPEKRPANLVDVADELLTLADTAALIEALDLVISIDSAPVHLAGALGKTAWLLLPYRYEWRWGLSGMTNRWYDAVKVFRQRWHGDWESVLQEVFAERLPAWLSQREN